MTTWSRLNEVGYGLDRRVGEELEARLNEAFPNLILAFPISDRRILAEGLSEVISNHEGLPAFRVVRLSTEGEESTDAILDWLDGSPVWATPDTLARETRETLDGFPFIELVSSSPVRTDRDTDVLSAVAEGWRTESPYPDVYFFIPGSILLHPWQGMIEVLEPQL